MARVRRLCAAWALTSAFVVGSGVPVTAHDLEVEHTAAAYCIVNQFGGAGLQSYVGNAVALPLQEIWTSPGGWYGGTSYTTLFSPRWVWYSARAYWWTGTAWASRDGNWIAAEGQLGQATAWTTQVQTASGWVTATTNLLYNGADKSRPDSSLIDLPGRGSYYIYGHFFWSAVFSGSQLVRSSLEHWEPLGWLTCQ